MQTITSTLITEAVFSDDHRKRYLLKKTWDASLPKLAIILLAPSIASTVELDSTTILSINNSYKLGFGSLSILNLFATSGDFTLSEAENEDSENLNTILEAVQDADVVIYAPGVGKNKLPVFLQRSKQVLEALRPYEYKLKCLTSASGKSRNLHALCPAVRTWNLAELRIDELLPKTGPVEPKLPKKKGRPTVIRKEA